MKMQNPFDYNAATSLDEEQITSLFIQDYNYSRFILSKRNVFLLGERGCGKTMTLLFNKFTALSKLKNTLQDQSKIHEKLNYIPVYVSCINPLNSKREYLLLDDDFKASVISEHFLALSIAISIAETLQTISSLFTDDKKQSLKKELEYIFDDQLPENENVFLSLKSYLKRELTRTQKEINRADSDSFFNDTFTFSSLVMPIIDSLQEQEEWVAKSHIIFMIDDAHDLNTYQQSVLNSWVAYRNNSQFSFKISAAKVPTYSLKTASGGSILKGHDYVQIDVEQPFQNNNSSFSKLAKKIVEKRLEILGIDKTAEEFFPVNPSLESGIKEASKKAKSQGETKYKNGTAKQITDYVYKYGRAIYFRERSSKANKPPYSGFETIVGVSSGVIRNMLEPCFIMYDDALSESNSPTVSEIVPKIQTDVFKRLSESAWESLREGVDKNIDGCTEEEAKYVENLFNALAEFFKKRLMDESCSEPRAIAFSISEKNNKDIMDRLIPILNIARKAQYLYVRPGNAKDRGESEDYYVPNKILWTSRGLDPIGQHARTSIKATELLDAALKGNPIKTILTNDDLQTELKI